MSSKSLGRIVLAGGLGNQLFQYAFALNLEDKFDLELETQMGHPRLNERGVPEVFDFLPSNIKVSRVDSDTGLNCRRITSLILRLRLHDSDVIRVFGKALLNSINLINYLRFKNRFILQVPSNVGWFEDLLNSKHNRLYYGYFQSFKWAQQEEIFSQLYKLSPTSVSAQFESYRDLALKERPLIVHIRQGDYITERKIGVLSHDYYVRSLRAISAHQFEHIWIFTDDESNARKVIPEDLMGKARWIPMIDGNSSQTLELMRYGAAYIIANSTFSWWGAFLSYTPDAKVIAPNPWFAIGRSPDSIIPKSWTVEER
jgi:hypothetical protein